MDKKHISNFLRAPTKSNDSFAFTSNFIPASSLGFVATLIEIFFYINFIKNHQKSLPTNSNNFISPFILGKHIVKDFLRITKLYKEIIETIKAFA